MSTLKKKPQKLNNSNYYSDDANREYISVSQYKTFFGTLGYKGCEAQAMAEIRGDYKRETTTAMLMGSYVDSYFEGTLEGFKQEHPEIFKKDGELKSEYKQADEIIKRCERDKKFMQYMSGEKQTIMTGELFGSMWKIKMDSYIPGKCIVDLKVVEDIYKPYYHKDTGKLNFIIDRGYDFQLAIYQKIVELNTGKRLPCFIAAVDKQKVPNIEIISLSQNELDGTLAGLEIGINRIKLLKSGEAEPDRCNHCDWCKDTKIITKPVSLSALLEGVE